MCGTQLLVKEQKNQEQEGKPLVPETLRIFPCDRVVVQVQQGGDPDPDWHGAGGDRTQNRMVAFLLSLHELLLGLVVC